MRGIRLAFAASIAAVFLAAAPSRAGGLLGNLNDPQDGKLDLSDYLQSKSGFLPVPIIITEPAVGFGGGLAAVFLKRPTLEGTGGKPTPTIYGAAGAATENGTWGGAAFYLLPFSGDRYRLTGGAGYLDLHLKFYGFGAESPLQDHPVHFTIKTGAIFQRAQIRIGESDFYAGLQYLYLSTKSRFSSEEIPAGISERELESNVGGLGGMAQYDSRDNFLSPKNGVLLHAESSLYEPAFGSDTSFGKARLRALFFGQPLEKWGYGLRLESGYSWGDMPFYMRSTLVMRGLTGGKYLDKVSILGEAEPRYWIDPRWMVLVFGGAGKVAPSWSDLGSSETVWAGGFGFRYLLARKLGLQAGVDFGFGPSGQRAVYIQVGSPWR